MTLKTEDEILRRFGVPDMFALDRFYVTKDQHLFKNGRWNYDNGRLVINKIKTALEALPDDDLDDKSLTWKREILWFWYHHAISVAVSRGDIRLARKYAKRAVILQGYNHPNKITRLLWHLVHGRIREARRWFREGVKRPDRGTGREVLRWYEQGYFSACPERRRKA